MPGLGNRYIETLNLYCGATNSRRQKPMIARTLASFNRAVEIKSARHRPHWRLSHRVLTVARAGNFPVSPVRLRMNFAQRADV